MVPLVDLRRRASRYAEPFQQSVARILESGQVLLGPELERFEAGFAGLVGQAHCVAVSSGASAIALSLAALGIGPGDEVIVPAFTAVPTASAVCAVGAVPVPVDVEMGSATIDRMLVARACTSATRAVVPVHLYGRPALDGRFGQLSVPVAIVEDAAQAHGALRPGAGRGVATAYSFYPTKNLGGIGDGGAVTTDDGNLAARLRELRVHGMREQYVHTSISQNFRMSEIEAAWLLLQLPDLAAMTARRRTIAAAYRSAAPELAWQSDHPDHVHHLAVFRAADRAGVRAALEARGVSSAVHYPLALTRQPAYVGFARHACPNAERWAAQCVSVPMFPELTDAEVEHVCQALSEIATR